MEHKNKLVKRRKLIMGKIIVKNVVDRKPGHLYYVDGKGNVCEAKMARGGKKKKATKKKPVKKKVVKKKVVKNKVVKRKAAVKKKVVKKKVVKRKAVKKKVVKKKRR